LAAIKAQPALDVRSRVYCPFSHEFPLQIRRLMSENKPITMSGLYYDLCCVLEGAGRGAARGVVKSVAFPSNSAADLV
jgi:hypothetical protein